MVEVCAKILYQVELQRSALEQMWGFSVEAELIENADRQDELCCYVSRVEDKSVAMQNGNLSAQTTIEYEYFYTFTVFVLFVFHIRHSCIQCGTNSFAKNVYNTNINTE